MTIHACLAVFVLAIAPCSTLAQGQNQVLSAGYAAPSFGVAPGQILTLFTPPLNVPDATATQTPLAASLSGVSVLARVLGAMDTTGYPTSLPILRVYSPNICRFNLNSSPCSNTQITVEIPTEGVCAPLNPEKFPCGGPPFTDLPPLLVLNVRANAVTGPDVPLAVVTLAPRLLTSCDSVFGPLSADCHPLVAHADGALVSFSAPARVGETITTYAVGLGPGTRSGMKTGYPASAPFQISPSYGELIFGFRLTISATAPDSYIPVDHFIPPDWVGVTPGYIGLYQINAVVPPMPTQAAQCQSGIENASITMSSLSAGTLYICVQP